MATNEAKHRHMALPLSHLCGKPQGKMRRPSIEQSKARVEKALEEAAKGPSLRSGRTAAPVQACLPLARTEAEAKVLKRSLMRVGDSNPLEV